MDLIAARFFAGKLVLGSRFSIENRFFEIVLKAWKKHKREFALCVLVSRNRYLGGLESLTPIYCQVLNAVFNHSFNYSSPEGLQ